MFEWIEELYGRVREHLTPARIKSLDEALEHGGYGVVFGDSVEKAASLGILTNTDRRKIEEILDFGLLRKAKPYFMDLIAA